MVMGTLSGPELAGARRASGSIRNQESVPDTSEVVGNRRYYGRTAATWHTPNKMTQLGTARLATCHTTLARARRDLRRSLVERELLKGWA